MSLKINDLKSIVKLIISLILLLIASVVFAENGHLKVGLVIIIPAAFVVTCFYCEKFRFLKYKLHVNVNLLRIILFFMGGVIVFYYKGIMMDEYSNEKAFEKAMFMALSISFTVSLFIWAAEEHKKKKDQGS